MITLLLEYPDNIDAYQSGLALPENVSCNEQCLLTFRDFAHYHKYIDNVCDIVDELESSAFFKRSPKRILKLKFCKVYLNLLLQVKFPSPSGAN